jgi:DNA-binding transcriptional LysR family regulator
LKICLPSTRPILGAAVEDRFGAGRLRISAPVTFARLQIVPRLPTFLAENPALEIDLVLEDRDVDSIAEGIDVALWIGPFADSPLIARKIASCRRIVVGAPAYFDAMGVPQKPTDLLGHQTVIYDQRQGGQSWTFRQGSAEVSVTVNGRLCVSAAEGAREAVFAGLGLSIGGSEWMFTPELKSGVVKVVLADWSLPQGELWAAFPTGGKPAPKRWPLRCSWSGSFRKKRNSEECSADYPQNAPNTMLNEWQLRGTLSGSRHQG